MAWEHFSVCTQGACTLRCKANGTLHAGHYQLGSASTGRSRVGNGYWVSIAMNGQDKMGRSTGRGNLHEALCNVAAQWMEAGFILQVVALREDWHETGLSTDTGFGYVLDGVTENDSPIHRSVHMMDAEELL